MKSNSEWVKWGVVDPLFAVSSQPGKEKGGANPWMDDEFYALGKSDCDDFVSAWTSFGYDKRHCLEIGCGAGRITMHLADFFDSVTAIDVSEEQIKYAKNRINQSNICYFKTNGIDIPLEAGTASAVFSSHVFQHFDSKEDAVKVFNEIYRILQPGGTIMIHLPLHSLPTYAIAPFLAGTISLYKILGTLKANLNRRAGRLIMRGLSYDKTWLTHFIQDLGFHKLEFRALQVKSNQHWHDFLLAQK